MNRNTSAKTVRTLSKLVRVDEEELRGHLDKVVRGSVEETLNLLLDEEAKTLCQADRYERSAARKGFRSGSYQRKLHTKAGEVTLKVPKLKHVSFETAIIERYRRRETSVEEALVEMYLAGVSVRRVEDITEALWGTKVSPSVVSSLNQKIYVQMDAWRTRKLDRAFPYIYLDGIFLKRSWGGEVRNVAVLVCIGVDEDGYREVLGCAEGAKEDEASWRDFLRSLKQRGLKGVKLIISDKCLGLVEALGEFYPQAHWQRCVVHFYRNVFSVTPHNKVKEVVAMLKAIHAQEDIRAAKQKIRQVVEKLRAMRLPEAAQKIEESCHETLAYYHFPSEHWRKIRTNNPLERIMKEIRRRTRVVGSFPDGKSALMLATARLRHIAGTKWGTVRYLNMGRIREMETERKYAKTA